MYTVCIGGANAIMAVALLDCARHSMVLRMQAGQPRRKRPRKALAQMQELFRGVKVGRKAHRLAELIKEIHEQQIREVGEQLFFQSTVIIPHPGLWS